MLGEISDRGMGTPLKVSRLRSQLPDNCLEQRGFSRAVNAQHTDACTGQYGLTDVA